MPKTNLRASHIPEMRAWYGQGRSLRWIALAYGCSDRTVAAYLGVCNRRTPARHDPVVLARAYDSTETTGERVALATAMGFPSLGALRAAVCYAKAGLRARGEVWLPKGEEWRRPRRYAVNTYGSLTEPCP